MWEKVVYLGKIGRQLQICLNGHIDAFLKNQRNKSAFASHLLESGHSEKMVKVSLLHEEHRWPRGLLSLSLSLSPALIPILYTVFPPETCWFLDRFPFSLFISCILFLMYVAWRWSCSRKCSLYSLKNFNVYKWISEWIFWNLFINRSLKEREIPIGKERS